MPPRIPIRHCVELVQLGVLLPWAARASSNSFCHQVEKRDANSAGEASGSKWKSRTKPRRSLLDVSKNSIIQQPFESETVQPTVVHRLLAQLSPPQPDEILSHLKANPSELTRSAGELLIAYSKRCGDFRTQKDVLRLMIDRRILSLGHAKRARDMKRNKRAGGWKVRPNWWAMQTLPPVEFIPDSSRYTMSQLFGRLHHLLLLGEAPSFDHAWKLLENATDFEPVGKGKGKKTRLEDTALLNLYLAYLKPPLRSVASPSTLLEQYLLFSSQPPNRQTLHLSIKALLSSPATYSQKVKVIPAEIISIISRFMDFQIPPGLETWRQIADYALNYRLRKLGQMAWEGWFDCFRSSGISQLYSLSPNQINVKLGVRVKFERIGTQKKRWTKILRRMELKQWVEKVEGTATEALAGDRWGYVWKGSGNSSASPDVENVLEKKMEGKEEVPEKKGKSCVKIIPAAPSPFLTNSSMVPFLLPSSMRPQTSSPQSP
ncbi:hypothetical protein C366_03715 [Cryptococcus neoformans Tu401-1]|nr:hypothetical protein C366_03715 [Cryptococcus neoformans var. grubii Tu401-1]